MLVELLRKPLNSAALRVLRAFVVQGSRRVRLHSWVWRSIRSMNHDNYKILNMKILLSTEDEIAPNGMDQAR